MQSQDDPEARIRDLERPLADVARTSELGTTEYPSGADYNTGAYMPPPVLTYGAPPYMGTPQKPKSGFNAWWLFAGIAVVLIFIAGGVIIFSTSMFKLDSATRPPVEIPEVLGGGGEIDKAPSGGQPGTPGGSIVETPSAAPAVPTPPGEYVSISGVGKKTTIACDERAVGVSGSNNVVTITGHCASLTVSGMDNHVTVDSSAIIMASGFDNIVTFHTGTPEIGTGGFNNVVEQG
ncbi:DUF3060 domain-containing protein [Mycobacterium sp.]|uniref:DUF3060 domain-containing protein n=1 Tax=Mycobacterium sp. TaxID=1785 RepID=UPI002DA901E0|nr:DUF3060 domain-containing protein [Mycobacterium sp.]